MTKRTTIQLDDEVEAAILVYAQSYRPSLSTSMALNHLAVEALSARGLWPYRTGRTNEARADG